MELRNDGTGTAAGAGAVPAGSGTAASGNASPRAEGAPASAAPSRAATASTIAGPPRAEPASVPALPPGAGKPPSERKSKQAPNIVDYVQTKFATFDEKLFTDVDSLVLSVLSYFHLPAAYGPARTWEGMRVADLFQANRFQEMYGTLWDPDSSGRLLAALAASPRFRDVVAKGYVVRNDPEQEKQFSALTLQLSPDCAYIAFRGTDNTILGWKEDFNLAFQYPIPSQREAMRYADEAAAHASGRLMLGGHSKGGNLAVFAAFNCSDSTYSRIDRVFSHDGPGFPGQVFRDGSISKVNGLLRKTLPQSSIVGMLLEHQEDYRIVKSSTFSAFQHDPYSWVVEDGSFVALDSLTPAAKYLDLTLNEWVQSLSPNEREQVVDAVYALVESSGQTTMAGMRDNWQKALPEIIASAMHLDDKTRSLILQAVKELVVLGGRKLPEMFGRGKEDDPTESGS